MVVATKKSRHVNIPVTTNMEVGGGGMDYQDWRPRAEFVCEKDEHRQYLRQEAMKEFLSQVRDGETFAFRGLLTSKQFGQPEFYLAIKWMRIRNLVEKVPGGYSIKSIEMVRRAWNEEVIAAVKI